MAFTGIACQQQPPAGPAAGGGKKLEPPAIQVITAQPGKIQRVIQQPGTVQPDEETQLMAKLSGYVDKVHADIGQSVRGPRFNDKGVLIEPGQVLAELSVPETEQEYQQKLAQTRQSEAAVEQSRKALTAADAHVNNAEALVEEAKASLNKAQALYDRWQSEAKRVAGLVATGVMDQQTHDETMNQFKAAEANRNEAKARIASAESAVRKAQADRGKAEADVQASMAKVDVCQADTRRMAALLSYAKIRAPFDGVVTSRKINTGDLIAPSANRPAIFTIARLNPVRIVVMIPEADAGLISEKIPVDLHFQTAQNHNTIGQVTRTSWSLEPGSRTLRAEIDVPNADGKLRPGMYVNARVRVDIPALWLVPMAAMVKTTEASHCYLVVNGKAIKHAVVLGRSDGKNVEILKIQRNLSGSSWDAPSATDQFAMPAASIQPGQEISTISHK